MKSSVKCTLIRVAAKKTRISYERKGRNESGDFGDFLPPEFKYDTEYGLAPRDLVLKLLKDTFPNAIYKGHGFVDYYQAEGETGYRKPQPGDMWFKQQISYMKDWYWDNDDGNHLFVMLPNGHSWDIDSRAGNCDLPKDRTHRCWVRKGEPPNITISKDGHTCTAGAGSIQSGDYHGFLKNGVLEEC